MRKNVLSKQMREAVMTMVTEYGNPSLGENEKNDVLQFIEKNWHNPLVEVGMKTRIIGWSILHCYPLAQYYACLRYKRKMKQLQGRGDSR